MSSNAEAFVCWFTGLSGSGKSTLAARAKELLQDRGLRVMIIDGDDLRASTARHLGFTPDDIAEANRIAIEACRGRLRDADVLLVTRVSPSAAGRQEARRAFSPRFAEVYVNASLDAARNRDPKGLYRRAKSGESAPMIGTTGGAPFEPPADPDLRLDTETAGADELARRLAQRIQEFVAKAP